MSQLVNWCGMEVQTCTKKRALTGEQHMDGKCYNPANHHILAIDLRLDFMLANHHADAEKSRPDMRPCVGPEFSEQPLLRSLPSVKNSSIFFLMAVCFILRGEVREERRHPTCKVPSSAKAEVPLRVRCPPSAYTRKILLILYGYENKKNS
jgi:hypothetical protein